MMEAEVSIYFSVLAVFLEFVTLTCLIGVAMAMRRLFSVEKAEQRALRKGHALVVNTIVALRRPLNGIMAISELAKSDDNQQSAEEWQVNIDLIEDCSNMMMDQLQKIQNFSELQAKIMVQDWREESLPRLLNDVMDPFIAEFKEKGIDYRLKVHSDLSRVVKCHGDLLKIALAAIVDNAVKYTPGGMVQLHVKKEKGAGRLKFEVIDTGVGLSEKRVQEFLHPTDPEYEDISAYCESGFGLPTVRTLVQQLGGEIGMQSDLGYGTSVWFTVPAKEMPAESMSRRVELPDNVISFPTPKSKLMIDPELEKEEFADAPATVLIVDDEAFSRDLMKVIVGRLGFEADTATNGVEAVKMASSGQYEMIFMDIQMPEMDGWEASQQIIKDLGAKRPRITATTSHARTKDLKYSREIGMDAFVSKPIKREAIRKIFVEFGMLNEIYEPVQIDAPDPVGPRPELKLVGSEDSVVESLLEVSERKDDRLIEFDEMLRFYDANLELCLMALSRGRESFEENSAAIELAAHNSDADQVKFMVHKIKGEFGFICCQKGLEQCQVVYDQLREGRSFTQAELYDLGGSIQDLMLKAMEEMDEYLGVTSLQITA